MRLKVEIPGRERLQPLRLLLRVPLLVLLLLQLRGLGQEKPPAPIAPPPKTLPSPQATVALRGRLVCLAEDMHQTFGAQLPTGHTHLPGFKTSDGRYYSLLRTKLSDALFSDLRLQQKELRLHGQIYPGTQILDVTTIQSIRNGVVHELYYWCEICAIRSVVPDPCMCCQEPVILTEKPASDSPPTTP